MIKHLIFSFCVLLSGVLVAQETEGHIQYAIEVQAVDTTLKARQQAGLLRNSKMDIYFMDDFSRVDFKMGQLYTLTAIVDLKSERVLSLMNSPMGKFASRTHTSEDTIVETVDSTAVVELIDEKKVILGYTCRKAVVTSGDNTSTYWYTDGIEIDLQEQQFVNATIPGFPLEFHTIQEGVLMHYKASNIEFDLEGKEKEIFSTIIPAGYTIMQNVE